MGHWVQIFELSNLHAFRIEYVLPDVSDGYKMHLVVGRCAHASIEEAEYEVEDISYETLDIAYGSLHTMKLW